MNKDVKELTISEAATLTKVNARIPNIVNLELNQLAEKKGCSISTIINDAFSCFLENLNINIYDNRIIDNVNSNIAEQFKKKLNDYISSCGNKEFILFYIANIEQKLQDTEKDKFIDLIWSLVEVLYRDENNVSKRQILNLLCYQKQYIKDVIKEVLKQDFVQEKLKCGKLELLKSLNLHIE